MNMPAHRGRRGMRWVLVLVAVAAALLGVFVRHQLSDAPPPADGAVQLLALTLPDDKDQPQALSQWRGQPLVVNFWATWCPPCREEMPLFDQAARDFAGAGVQFVGISIDDPAAARAYAVAHPTSYPLLMGSMDILGLTQQLGNSASALPFTVLIRADGSVQAVKLGPYHGDELANAVSQLLPTAPTR